MDTYNEDFLRCFENLATLSHREDFTTINLGLFTCPAKEDASGLWVCFCFTSSSCVKAAKRKGVLMAH
ncbi:unnamed protein product [Caretta caretta]